MWKTNRHDVKLSRNMTVAVIQDDIINVKAGAVVSGEGPKLDKESFVTKALQEVSPSFKAIRRDLKRQFGELKLWTVQTTALGIPFQYVIHAVLDSQRNSQSNWRKNMKKLYHRIFEAAEHLPIRDIAVPLLGAGTAHTDKSLAVQTIVESMMTFSPKFIKRILIVNKDKFIIDMIITQFQFESGNTKVDGGLLSKLGSIKCQIVDFVSGPTHEERYRNGRDKIYQEEQRQLERALKLSREEAKSYSRSRTSSTTWYTDKTCTRPRTNHDGCSFFQSKSSERSNSVYPMKDEEISRSEQVINDEDKTDLVWKKEDMNSVHRDRNMSGHLNDDGIGIDLTCPICLSPILEPKQLDKCGHVFCEDCIDRCFRDYKPVCPSCNMVYGVITGNQPDGNMDVGFGSQSLPGYEEFGTITITYYFPSGIQQDCHPSPGQPFKGTTRRAYLPDCQEGRAILTLLRIAFDRKLTFTIGRSTSTGQEGVLTWNDIHHKTNIDGGPTRFGYPDPTYLTRVRAELASKGVTDAIMSSP